jgi:predicted TIM-barrel fold metal-dependent hydrolase
MAMSAKIAVVDCHHHLWDLDAHPDYPWLQQAGAADAPPDARLPRTYAAADYLRDMESVDLIACVHVEAGWRRSDPCSETAWLATQIASHGCPSVAVAYADLTADDVEAVLAKHSEFGFVRGIRMRLAETHRALLALRPDDNPMVDPRWRSGFARLKRYGFSFELQVAPPIMADAAALADAFPDTLIIISHLGFPMDRSADGSAAWRRALAELARRENVVVKLSGLAMMGLWPSQQNIADVVDHAVAVFGPNRVMFGTNYPVDLKNLNAEAHLRRHLELVAKFSAAEAAAMLGGNAVWVYRL